MAAVEVLQTAGFQVEMPLAHVCCGRPLYDFGFLNEAENYLRRVLRVLRPVISAGAPIVVLEPGCASVFRDEMLNLLPRDEQAQRLSKQVFLLSEFLEQRQKGDSFPALRRDAIVHTHYHQKSILGADSMTSTLHRLGLNCDVLNSGCCGMAGSFGFEREKYEVSVACGERVLLPAVRNAGMSALIIADGFSCREQIRQCTDRHALHLAEVLQMSLHQEKRPIQRIYPERGMVEARASAVHKSMSRTSVAAAASAGGAALAFLLAKSRQRAANGDSANEEMESKSHRTGA